MRPADAVLREEQVEDGGDQVAVDATHGYAAREVGGGAVGGVEARHTDDDGLGRRCPAARGPGRRRRARGSSWPTPASPYRWPRDPFGTTGSPVRGVDQHGLEGGVLLAGVVGEVGGGEELAGGVLTVSRLLEADQVGQVGVGLHVLGEVGRLPVDEELLQHDVAHRHREGGVRAGLGRQPLVGELHVVGVVGGDRDDLLAAVARLGHPVRVRGAGDGEVGAPHDQVARVPPVTGLGDVGLVAEDLR